MLRRRGRWKECIALIILLCVLCLLAGCNKKRDEIKSIDDLGKPGQRIGVMLNCPEESLLREKYPEAEIVPYKDVPFAFKEVTQGRVDCLVYARICMELAIERGTSGVKILDGTVNTNKIVCPVSPLTKIPDLMEKLNTFIAEKKADGTLDDMYDRWVIQEDESMPEIPKAKDPKFTLKVGTAGIAEPYTYYKGDQLNGYDIELAYRFASWLGANVEFKVYDFAGLLSAAGTGDVDCVMSNIYYIPESPVPLSNPVFETDTAILVADAGAGGESDEAGSSAAQSAGTGTSKTLADMQNATLAIQTGTSFPETVEKRLPDAEMMYFNSLADMLNALKSHKVDGVPLDEPVSRSLMAQDPSVATIPEMLDSFDFAYVFPKKEKGKKLCNEVNKYLDGLEKDGRLEELQEKWFDTPDPGSVKTTDYRKLPDKKGKIKMAVCTYPPFVLPVDQLYGGYEVEIMTMFCRDRGYALEIADMNLDGLLAGVQTGKYDMGASCMTITEERKETTLFSKPDYSGGTVILVLADEAGGEKESRGSRSSWLSIVDSFKKTFIRENRWKLFISGTVTTLLITVMSIIFGTVLGFVIYMLCRNGNPLANKITGFCIWLVQGMPVVVLLMILYYVIFGALSVSGTAVAIVGFTLIFGASVFCMVKNGVETVDYGQVEAAYTLGYRDIYCFFRIVLPQALPHIMPNYMGEITGLVKATAVVGYIAVQDLTKMGDIIRSRTYEAFFPLIAVAIIYFILAGALKRIVKWINHRIDPRNRKPEDIMKGVDL